MPTNHEKMLSGLAGDVKRAIEYLRSKTDEYIDLPRFSPDRLEHDTGTSEPIQNDTGNALTHVIAFQIDS